MMVQWRQMNDATRTTLARRYADTPMARVIQWIIDHASTEPRMGSADFHLWAPVNATAVLAGWMPLYDLDCSLGHRVSPAYTAAEQAMWAQLTTLRADAVLIRGDTIMVIEIKPLGGAELLGQLLLGRQHAQQTPLAHGSVQWVGLCGRIDAHAGTLLADANILLLQADDEDQIKTALA